MSTDTKIKLSSNDLVLQAPTTVQMYLQHARRDINEAFGDEDYAYGHPELVAAYIKACSMDFDTSMRTAKLQDLTECLANGFNDIAETLRNVR